MGKIQRLCVAIVLLFVLTGSAVAGHIGTDAVPPPPPPPQSATVADSDTTGPDATQSELETLITEITLSVLQLLSGF